jgi:hypothetical protein
VTRDQQERQRELRLTALRVVVSLADLPSHETKIVLQLAQSLVADFLCAPIVTGNGGDMQLIVDLQEVATKLAREGS